MAELHADSPALTEADLVIVELGDQPMRRLREVARIGEQVGLPVLVVARPDQVVLMEGVGGVTDFMVSPVHPAELRLRIGRLVRPVTGEEILRFKDLELNPLNYQATLAGKPVDLTYMEYELLRFLVENPVRVWSREQLLSRVWGYDYYGGARTVDVHVRRLRAKLGEERSSWISTVRSVGYRFG
ncbi:MAG: response regulator transcription factor [Actinobacteria bacterium]|nr:response regulator transcription factor [Actinomycetota bacterium]